MPKNRFEFYTDIAKIEPQEDGSIKVFGIASSDALDHDGERTSPEAFKAALPEFFATGPALREMHLPIAAGTVFEARVDSAGKAHIGALVVDEGSIKKVKTGVLRGFSWAGPILRRNKGDPSILEAIKIREISLVDRPANPEAMIEVWKAEAENKGGRPRIHGDGSKIDERDDTTASAGADKYGDVKFADPVNKKYPIDTKDHARAALSYWGKAKNRAKYSAADQKTIGDRIRAAAKHFEIDVSADDAGKVDLASKSLYDVASLADLVSRVVWMAEQAEYERICEGDASTVPDELIGHARGLADTLQKMTAEELAELLGDDPTTEDDDTMKAEIDEAVKAAVTPLNKRIADLEAANADLTAKHDEASKALKSGKVDEAVKRENELLTAQKGQLAAEKTVLEGKVAGLEAEKTELGKAVNELASRMHARGMLRSVPVSKDDDVLGTDDAAAKAEKDRDSKKSATELIRDALKVGDKLQGRE